MDEYEKVYESNTKKQIRVFIFSFSIDSFYEFFKIFLNFKLNDNPKDNILKKIMPNESIVHTSTNQRTTAAPNNSGKLINRIQGKQVEASMENQLEEINEIPTRDLSM